MSDLSSVNNSLLQQNQLLKAQLNSVNASQNHEHQLFRTGAEDIFRLAACAD
jgi:hypothetical protein